MFDWLFEGRTTVYLLLITVAVVLLAVWWKTRQRKYVLAGGVVAALAGGYFLLSVTRETDSKQLTRKLQEMAGGVREHKLDQTFAHVSESFHVTSLDKKAFRQKADDATRRFDLRDMEIWEVKIEEIARQARAAKVSFNVKAKGNWGADEAFYRCRAEFVLDPDDQWRLKSFQLFHPFVDSDRPLPLPF